MDDQTKLKLFAALQAINPDGAEALKSERNARKQQLREEIEALLQRYDEIKDKSHAAVAEYYSDRYEELRQKIANTTSPSALRWLRREYESLDDDSQYDWRLTSEYMARGLHELPRQIKQLQTELDELERLDQ